MHTRGVVPEHEGLPALARTIHEVHRTRHQIVLNRRHAFAVERTAVPDGLLADAAEPGVHGGVIFVGRFTFKYPAWSEQRLELLTALRIVVLLGLFLGIEVIEVSVEIVETVNGRQILVTVAEVVLARLTGHVSQRLEQISDGGVFGLEALHRARHANRCKAGTHRDLPGDECRASGCATRLAVVVRMQSAFCSDAVDIGRRATHDPTIVSTDVKPADVVGHNEKNVWQASRCRARSRTRWRDCLRLRQRGGTQCRSGH